MAVIVIYSPLIRCIARYTVIRCVLGHLLSVISSNRHQSVRISYRTQGTRLIFSNIWACTYYFRYQSRYVPLGEVVYIAPWFIKMTPSHRWPHLSHSLINSSMKTSHKRLLLHFLTWHLLFESSFPDSFSSYNKWHCRQMSIVRQHLGRRRENWLKCLLKVTQNYYDIVTIRGCSKCLIWYYTDSRHDMHGSAHRGGLTKKAWTDSR